MLELFNLARHEARLRWFNQKIEQREKGTNVVEQDHMRLKVPPAGNDFAGSIVNLFNANPLLAVWGVSYYMEPDGAKDIETRDEIEQLLIDAVDKIKIKNPNIDIELKKAFKTWQDDGSTQQIHGLLLRVVSEFADLDIDILAVGSTGAVKE